MSLIDMADKKLDKIKTSGFKTPKDYFSQVEEQILNEVKLIDKVNTSGFEVPKSYFNTVETNILNTISSENDTKVLSFITWKKVMYTTVIAASLVLMFNVFYNTSESVSIDDIETASIETYLEQGEYTSYDLASLLTEDELTLDTFTDTEIPDGTIEDYLLDQTEIEDLIIEQTQ